MGAGSLNSWWTKCWVGGSTAPPIALLYWAYFCLFWALVGGYTACYRIACPISLRDVVNKEIAGVWEVFNEISRVPRLHYLAVTGGAPVEALLCVKLCLYLV